MYEIYIVLQHDIPNFPEGFMVEYSTNNLDNAISRFNSMILNEIENQTKNNYPFNTKKIILLKNDEVFLFVEFVNKEEPLPMSFESVF